MTVKKTGTMTKNFTSKSLAKVKSSKKHAEDNEGEKLLLRRMQRRMWGKSSSLKEHGEMKKPDGKNPPKGKDAIKVAKTSAKKGKGTKFGETRRVTT